MMFWTAELATTVSVAAKETTHTFSETDMVLILLKIMKEITKSYSAELILTESHSARQIDQSL